MSRILFAFAALSGLLSVAMGAFGAHALRDSLAPGPMHAFETAVSYQMSHSLALLVVCLLAEQWGRGMVLDLSAVAFVLGILLFSGSLYILALTGMKWLGPITPIGGVAFIVGWGLLLVAVWRKTAL